jgi:hypothetical protein
LLCSGRERCVNTEEGQRPIRQYAFESAVRELLHHFRFDREAEAAACNGKLLERQLVVARHAPLHREAVTAAIWPRQHVRSVVPCRERDEIMRRQIFGRPRRTARSEICRGRDDDVRPVRQVAAHEAGRGRRRPNRNRNINALAHEIQQIVRGDEAQGKL